MVKLRLANKKDVELLYPNKLKKTFYGITADNGKPIGVAGFYFDRNWILFAHITDELRKHKVTIWRAAKELLKAMKHLDQPVYAIADPSIPRSDHLLLKMGFKHVSKDWYVWTQ